MFWRFSLQDRTFFFCYFFYLFFRTWESKVRNIIFTSYVRRYFASEENIKNFLPFCVLSVIFGKKKLWSAFPSWLLKGGGIPANKKKLKKSSKLFWTFERMDHGAEISQSNMFGLQNASRISTNFKYHIICQKSNAQYIKYFMHPYTFFRKYFYVFSSNLITSSTQ